MYDETEYLERMRDAINLVDLLSDYIMVLNDKERKALNKFKKNKDKLQKKIQSALDGDT